MITQGAKGVANILLKEKIIKAEEIAIYEYGFELLISTAINFLMILAASYCLHDIGMGICYFGVLATIRPYSGGYHASSYLKCGAVYCAIFILTVLGSLGFIYVKINLAVMMPVLFINLYYMWRHAPVLHRNRLSDDEKTHAKKKAVGRCLVWSVLVFVVYHFNKGWAYEIYSSIIMISVFMAIGKKMEEKENEKRNEKSNVRKCSRDI